jgi:KDO2-lipid IV(A) lauroyltransferase
MAASVRARALESCAMRLLIHSLLFAFGCLPLAVLHALGALAGTLLWAVPNRTCDLARKHVAIAFPQLPQPQREAIVRASLRHMGMSILEAPAIWFGPRWRLQRWIRDEKVRAQLKAVGTRGLILLCPHIGSWELAGMLVSDTVQVTSLYKPQKGVFDELIKQGRARFGQKLAPSTIHGVKQLIEALRAREAIGILPDQDPPWGSGVFAPLFGVPAHTTELVSKLAARAQVPVWFLLAERLPWARGFRFHLVRAPDGIDDPASGPAMLNRGIEEVLRQMPQQYWWAYKRYRRRPPGEPEFY